MRGALGTAVLLSGSLVAGVGERAAASPPPHSASVTHVMSHFARCPWVRASQLRSQPPSTLANEVTSRMTLIQKVDFVVLNARSGFENINYGVPNLCIPALTLTDGPSGVASGLRGVTQFPAEIGVAATFDPVIAGAVGVAMGAETRGKGLDVLQGPDLNMARVPQSGRVFETFGEDPYLTSALGVAVIKGIQSTGVLADVKHFTGYTQENARGRIDQVITPRALTELYNEPFRAAVMDAHVASVMCSMGALNGVNGCSSPYIYATLRSWKFHGFVRTDYGSVFRAAPAFRAGLSLLKPGASTEILHDVASGALPLASLDRAVRAILSTMFAYGLIAHPRVATTTRVVTSPAHAAIALRTAEGGIVLLKDRSSVLPLPTTLRSVAVIGVDAQITPQTRGGGSSGVRASYVITPLVGLRAALGPRVRVSYARGGPARLELDQLTDIDLLTGKALPPQNPITNTGEPGKSDLVITYSKNVTAAIATAITPGDGIGWSHWQAKLRATKSGTYEISLQQIGDTWLYLDHRPLLTWRGLHGPTNWATTVQFRAGREYSLSADWFALNKKTTPTIGITNVTSQIAAAVAVARRAQVAIVFAGSFTSEGADQPNLYLPGDSNALISAVAAVNPHTIVVLNTGGAVLMPWLKKVSGVVEAWFPGQMDGAAIAAVLTGKVDPSGRLPITFPASPSSMPTSNFAQYPGINARVSFGPGLDLGYRWYQLHHVRPLFAFGFGLSYTDFRLSNATLSNAGRNEIVRVTVTNTGARAGSYVLQAYVHFPTSAGEPPEQLRGFAKVNLASHQSKLISLVLPPASFQIYRAGALVTVPGPYRIDLGSSSATLPIQLAFTPH